MIQSKYPSEKEKQIIDFLLKKVKKLNIGYSIAYIFCGFVFVLIGFLFPLKGDSAIWKYLVGGFFGIFGLIVIISATSSFFRKKKSSLIYSNILTQEGCLKIVAKYTPKVGTIYHFYLNESLLYLPNEIWFGAFINLNNKHLQLDLYPVPFSSSSVTNNGKTEYLVIGIFNYKEAENFSTETHASKWILKNIALILIFVTLMTFWQILGSSIGLILKGEYLLEYLPGNYPFTPLAIILFFHVLFIYIIMQLLKSLKKTKQMFCDIQKKLEHEINSKI
jgi:hypothetical protein